MEEWDHEPARHADALLFAELAAQLGVLPLELRGASLAALAEIYGEAAPLGRVLNLTRQLLGRLSEGEPSPRRLASLAEAYAFEPDPVEIFAASLAVCDPDPPDELLARLELDALVCCFVGAAAACILAEEATPTEFLAGLC